MTGERETHMCTHIPMEWSQLTHKRYFWWWIRPDTNHTNLLAVQPSIEDDLEIWSGVWITCQFSTGPQCYRPEHLGLVLKYAKTRITSVQRKRSSSGHEVYHIKSWPEAFAKALLQSSWRNVDLCFQLLNIRSYARNIGYV